jgi:molecular chaperone HscB
MTRFDRETLQQDFFTLFGLPRQQGLDADRLEVLYQDIQMQVHPDRHAHLSDSEKRLAMQWATQVNMAYQTLKDPLKRASYVLQLAGHDVGLESNTAMPAAFLMAQMELRETVAEATAAGDADRLDALQRRLRREMADAYGQLQTLLDAHALEQASALVRQLMFQKKLFQEVDDALTLLEN